jgi:aminopeptidase-like protein
MHALARELYPICRSLTGQGVRDTLAILQREVPELRIVNVPSGTAAFDWEVPREWNVTDAFLLDEAGRKVIDFRQNNLHLVGYSIPVSRTVSWEELNQHLFSLPEQPTAIPYVTSYYQEFWGFCLSHQERQKLRPGNYRVEIQTTLAPGNLTYAEALIPGQSTEEIFLSTYVCHPSMANNELSGPALATALLRWVKEKARRYSYRFAFVPETIGALTYASKNLDTLKKNVRAGFQLSCVGDERAFSYVPSRKGGTLADRVALNTLLRSPRAATTKIYTFGDRGSDERQYCAPGIDLPLCSVMRSKYGAYPEYHTSLDDLNFVTPAGLQGSFDAYVEMLTVLEENAVYRIKCLGEPQLGRRGLYPNLSTVQNSKLDQVKLMMDLIAYCDGTADLIEIAETLQVGASQLLPIVEKLKQADLLETVSRRVGNS